MMTEELSLKERQDARKTGSWLDGVFCQCPRVEYTLQDMDDDHHCLCCKRRRRTGDEWERRSGLMREEPWRFEDDMVEYDIRGLDGRVEQLTCRRRELPRTN